MIHRFHVGRQRLLKIGVPVAILATAMSIAGYLAATRPEVQADPARERVWPVAAVKAERTDVRPEVRFYGEVVAGRQVELRPFVEGRVVEVGPNFFDGAIVREGALLIAIDPFDFEAAVKEIQAQIEETEGKVQEYTAEIEAERALAEEDEQQVALGKREVERRDKLMKKGTGTIKALDDSRLSLSAQQKQLITRHQSIDRLTARVRQQEAVKARLVVARARARRDLEETRLTVPFDGFLDYTATAIGKRVGVGDRIATLIDANRLEVRFHAGNREFSRLLAGGGFQGRPARVVWRLGEERLTFEAMIDRVESAIEAQSGGVQLFARILDAGPESVLRPGAFVEVWVEDRTYVDVIRLSETALHDRDTVYKVVDGRLVPVRVEVVGRDGGQVLVRGDLAADDLVVVTRFAEIGPDVRVSVR